METSLIYTLFFSGKRKTIQGEMDLIKNSTIWHPTTEKPQVLSENTVTFLIGFGILIIFVLIGVLASAFLCMTLKKDSFLWEVVFDPQAQVHNIKPQSPINRNSSSSLDQAVDINS